MNIVLNSVFLITSLSSIVCSVNNDNLIALVQVFRHGERTPYHFYKNDPNKEYWGNLDRNQLTNEGRRQLYALGHLTRSRYSDWIPEKYNKNFIYAQTTDSDRTHMSGQSYLYGLFPATGDQIWLPNINWQAIPLHAVDPRIVYSSGTDCPAYQPIVDKLLATEEYFIKINEENVKLYAYLTENSGDNVTSIESAADIYDCLKVEHGVGLTLPQWTKTVFPNPLSLFSAVDLQSMLYTTQLRRYYAGTFLYEIMNYFKKMSIDATSTPKIQIYSVHETNLASLLASFGNFDPPYVPEFASTVWLELRTSNKTPYVNVWNKNGNNLTQIRINGCELDCSLNQFRLRLNDTLLDVPSWTRECSV